jgi:hypothetical protein
MYDYLFFDEGLKEKFIKKLNEHKTSYQETLDNGNLCIGIDEETQESLVDQIDDYYDILLDEQADITIAEEPESINAVGIQFTTKTGDIAQVKLDPKLVNKLHETLSFIELQELVQSIATAVATPQIIPLCKKD